MIDIIKTMYVEDLLDELDYPYELKRSGHFCDCVEDEINDEGYVHEDHAESIIDKVVEDFIWNYEIINFSDNTISIRFDDYHDREIDTIDVITLYDLEKMPTMNEEAINKLCDEIYENIISNMSCHYYDEYELENLENDIKTAIINVWGSIRKRTLRVSKELDIEQFVRDVNLAWAECHPERAKMIANKVFETFNSKLIHEEKEIEDFIKIEILKHCEEMVKKW